MIKFTIITCTYNAERVLQRTLDSVKKQTYCSIEHIIMDGGSSDKTYWVKGAKYITRIVYKVSALSKISE